jgi:hypothetical protein
MPPAGGGKRERAELYGSLSVRVMKKGKDEKKPAKSGNTQ